MAVSVTCERRFSNRISELFVHRIICLRFVLFGAKLSIELYDRWCVVIVLNVGGLQLKSKIRDLFASLIYTYIVLVTTNIVHSVTAIRQPKLEHVDMNLIVCSFTVNS